jgi:hypothetical protein
MPATLQVALLERFKHSKNAGFTVMRKMEIGHERGKAKIE